MKNIALFKYFSLIAISLLFTACDGRETPQSTQVTVPTQSNTTLSNSQQVKNCNFTASNQWWLKPYNSLPANIAKNPVTGDTEFCEFYQFSQDWFLYLISPSATPDIPNWETQKKFPLLETTGTNSCDDAYPKHALNIRTAKAADDSQPFAIPKRTDQAFAHAIYDQHGNVVFYEIRFSKNLCDYPAIQAKINFPGKTLEMKMAWRVLNNTEKNSNAYYKTQAIINKTPYTLGLIGWHIVVAADNHPEMVWMTVDHNNNAIDCNNIGDRQPAFNFTNRACAQDKNNCKHLNETLDSAKLKIEAGTAYDICKAFPYGTLEGQPIETKDGLNIALIKKINNDLQNTIFSNPKLPASLAVWKNYRFTGALWVSDIKQDAKVQKGIPTNQRGSLELANPVMETSFQGTSGVAGSVVNCFACHTYHGTATATPSNTGVKGSGKHSISHIFDEIIAGQK